MDPVGPWSAYASFNRLGVQSNAPNDHHLPGASSTPAGFLSPPSAYESVFSPIFHHANAKPSQHYASQQRVAKQTEPDYHQPFFEQNSWQPNSPFGILPHESANFNAHFAAQSINHLNNLAAKNVQNLRTQVAAQVIPPATTKSQTTFYPSTDSTSTNSKSYLTTNAQSLPQSCIVSSTIANRAERSTSSSASFLAAQKGGFASQHAAANKTLPSTTPIQTKAQAKIYPDLTQRTDDQPNSPISFSLNYGNANANKRAFQANYRHYQSGASNVENDFQPRKEFNASTNGPPDCNVVTPRRPSPLQAHAQLKHYQTAAPTVEADQPSPIGHAPTPPYPLYNTPLNSTLASPPTNQISTPLDVSVPRPTTQAHVAYSSVITRALNPAKSFNERYERTNCWDDRTKYNNFDASGNGLEMANRQADISASSHQMPSLHDLSSCRGDPTTIVKNLQQQQSQQQPACQVPPASEPQKRRKSSDSKDRIPPPAHSWNFPAPPPFKTQQHQTIMHHPPPPIPYFHPPFHLPHPELTPSYEQNNHQQTFAAAATPQDDQPKVVVPNIEEELNFLSEATPPPVSGQSKAINPPSIAKPAELKNPKNSNSGFMSSYIKFLQGERDSSPPPASRASNRKNHQNYARIKPLNTEIVKPTPPEPPPPTNNGTVQPTIPKITPSCDPQDDPRYFPLPKERKTFDSSDDGVSSEDDLFNRKVPPLSAVKERRKGRPSKGGSKRKPRAKKDPDKAVMALSAEEIENMPRRALSKRAAKDKVNLQLIEDDNEPQEFVDSDSDPAWTPAVKEDGSEDTTLRRNKRTKQGVKRGRSGTGRNILAAAAHSAGIHADVSDVKTARTLEDNLAAAVQTTGGQSGEPFFKNGEFVVVKAELGQAWPALWRIDDGNVMQKFEVFEGNGGQMLYRNVPSFTSCSHENRKQYLSVPITYKSQNAIEAVVEFNRKEMVLYDPEFIKRKMKESEGYQDNFEVYIQTLISQALDSNFLTEIFQEQDEYFLSNVKIVDDITEQRKSKLMSVLRWPLNLQVAVTTWPCFNVLTDGSSSDASLEKSCCACGRLRITGRVLMYGQPYNATTLEGSPPDGKIAYEKDFLMCRICVNKVELLNQITHQKYLMYIECSKRVAEKRQADPHKDTTCILNELLADERWLNQLFTDVRTYWAEVDCIAHVLSQQNIAAIGGEITKL